MQVEHNSFLGLLKQNPDKYPICLFSGNEDEKYIIPYKPTLIAKWQASSYTPAEFLTIIDEYQKKNKKRGEGLIMYLSFEAGLVIQGIIEEDDCSLYGLIYHYNNHLLYSRTEASLEIIPDKDIDVGDCTTYSSSNCRFTTIQKTERSIYNSWVDDALQKIAEGDFYQVNLAIKIELQSKDTLDLISVFERSLTYNPAPYSLLFNTKELKLVSSSPEFLFKHRAGKVWTAPIAATFSAANYGKLETFLQSEKESAEHLMLVDLERNDLSIASETKNINVKNYRNIKHLSKVSHLESIIEADAKNIKFSSLINTLFPGGSISGCPKNTVLKYINKKENFHREFYTGGVGYIDSANTICFNILIRTMQIFIHKVQFFVGSGIVHDSSCNGEWEEIYQKSKGIYRSLFKKQHA